MDDSTADLVLTLQLQELFDVYESLQAREDAGNGDISDLNSALSLSIEELRRTAAIISDRRIGQAIGEAENPDDQLQPPYTSPTPGFDELCTRLAETAIENLKNKVLSTGTDCSDGSSDARIIASLTDKSGGEGIDHVVGAGEGSIESQLAAMYIDKPSPGPLTTQETAGRLSAIAAFAQSITAALAFFGRKPVGSEGETLEVETESRPKTEPLVSCVSCGDGKVEQDLMLATCGDHYCQWCTRTLFDLATTDESLYPPRCCREPIPLADARHFLGEELISRFERKAIEFNTHDRTYCYGAGCSAFILPQHIDGDKATCAECHEVTCKICKSAAHENDCPEDPAREDLMVAAAAAGWQQCYRCKRLVELEYGCNHMT